MNRINESFFEWWEINSPSYSALLFDIDGTLLAGKRALPGAVGLLQWIRNNSYPFYLLTNDGNHSLQEKSSFLKRAGLEIAPDEIVSCSSAIKEFVDDNSLRGFTAFVMGDLGKPDYAEEAGLIVTRNTEKIEECSIVIVGEGEYDWYTNINAVLNMLVRHPERTLLVPNPDTYWPDGYGGFGIGAGGKARFIKSILDEMHAPVKIVYLGKPYKAIFEFTHHLLRSKYNMPDTVEGKRIIMIGDNLQSDILGGNTAGFTSVLMLTGVTSETQAIQAEKSLKADLIFRGFA
ncbi:MAG: hypothetical protein A2020_05560 [Lentisphaerae bacterium GWF2_45_14]|nr:MAG: hypothetical protein A2020_05560 [Lentisphaerae bacterium GWF2_45_14]